MRHLLVLFTVFLLFTTTLLAQSYHPLIQENSWWDEYYGAEDGICHFDSGEHYWFSGDTVIGGLIYQKVNTSPVFSALGVPFCPPYFADTTMHGLLYYIREDVALQKVFITGIDGQELLLYDFSLLPGDSMTFMGITIHLDSIVETVTADGETRRKFHFNNAVIWLEGVGNVNSLWFPPAGICICQHSLCCVKKGEYVYGTMDICSSLSAAYTRVESFELPVISPNPFAGQTYVEASQQWEKLEVYNTGGQKIKEWNQPALNVEVSIDQLGSSGLFFFVFTRKDGLKITKAAFNTGER